MGKIARKLPSILEKILPNSSSNTEEGTKLCKICKKSHCQLKILTHINPLYWSTTVRLLNLRRLQAKKAKWRLKNSTLIRSVAFHGFGRKFFVCSNCRFQTNVLGELQLHFSLHPKSPKKGRSTSHIFPTISEISADSRLFSEDDEPMSLMENAENPDEISLPDYSKMINNNLENFTLSVKHVGNMDDGDVFMSNGPFLPEKLDSEHSEKPKIKQEMFFWDLPTEVRSNGVTGLRRNCSGYFCPTCYGLFADYESYDAHINSEAHSGELPNPISVALRTESNLPTSLGLRYRFPKFVLNSSTNWSHTCTMCGRREFENTQDFHEHIILCGHENHAQALKEREFATEDSVSSPTQSPNAVCRSMSIQWSPSKSVDSLFLDVPTIKKEEEFEEEF